jgi:hypothetical protein
MGEEATAGPVRPIRPPAGWADAQRELAGRLAVGDTIPATAVRVQWWTADGTWVPRYGGRLAGPIVLIQGVRMLIRRARRGPAGTFVALWRQDLDDTVDPDLVFKASPGDLPSPDGTGDATVLGEYAPNGALVVALEHGHIRPIYNPQHPSGDLTRYLRSSDGRPRSTDSRPDRH